MARNFRDYVRDVSPTWLRKANFWGERFFQGMIGYLSDLTLEAATQAVKAHMVKQSTSPNDALPGIGRNFNIDQVPGETNANFRSRLSDSPGAWELWEESATDQFHVNALDPFGVPAASLTLITRNGYKIQYPSAWNRWWIVAAPTLPWTEDLWGTGEWGDVGAGTWGSSASEVQIAGILKLLNKWKSAHEIGAEMILNFHDHVWGAGTVWGAPGTWGINGVVRWRLGRFWDSGGVWGDLEPYRPTLAGTWGGKIVI